MKLFITFFCFVSIVFSCPAGVAYAFYRSGNANGSPVLSMDEKEKSGIYLNGNCGGRASWSVERRGAVSYLYDLEKSIGVPVKAVRFRHGMAEFYPTGNLTGSPEKSLKFYASSMAFYPNGNGNGFPTMFLKKRGRLIEIYRNGNGNGSPWYSIAGPWNEQKIAELFFVLLSLGYLAD